MSVQAGIAAPEYPDQLLIALEPEAASIYVRRLRLHQLVPERPIVKPITISPKRQSTPEPMNMDRVSDDFRQGRRDSLGTACCIYVCLVFVLVTNNYSNTYKIFSYIDCFQNAVARRHTFAEHCNIELYMYNIVCSTKGGVGV